MTRQTRSSTSPATIGLILFALLVAAAIVWFLFLRGDEPPLAEPSPSAAPTPSPTFNQALLEQRLTVLLVGKDVNEEREQRGDPVNTDTLILASVSADQSEVTLISLPRDTVDIPLPDGGVYDRKVNGIYGTDGIDTLVAAMEALFEVEIDGYAAIDMDDLVALVDAVDGVEVSPEEPLTDPIVDLDLEAGPQTLDGTTALAYVRTRVDKDYGRAARAQEVVLALVGELVAEDAEIDLAGLIDGLDSLETDLPLEDLPTLVEIARRAQAANVTTQVLEPTEFITFEGDRGDGRGYILEPDIEAIRAFAAEHIGPD